MKHTKIVLFMVVPALVLLLLGGNMRPPEAQAKVAKVLTITDALCLTLAGNVDWNGNGELDKDGDGAQGLLICRDLGDEGNFRTLTRVLEQLPVTGDTSNPEPEDFAKIDLDKGQIHEDDQIMYVVAFVGSDGPMGFYADKGIFTQTGRSNAQCGPPGDPTSDFSDEDCDGDGVRGDGVVALGMIANGADRGPGEFRVRQGHFETTEPYTIVGEPDHITVKAIDAGIQTGAPVCELFSDTPSFLAIDKEPETSPVIATVTDSDGTAITGAVVRWSITHVDNHAEDGSDMATFVIPPPLTHPAIPSVDLQALGVGAPEVICGADKAGTVRITAKITDGSDKVLEFGAGLDSGGTDGRSASIEFPVQGPPEKMVLSVSPTSIACDGTSSATVSATLTDADGNPVMDGNRVDFDVQTLATANPLNARTVKGVATSVITPLAGLTSGVAVGATWMRHVIKGGELPPTPEPPKLVKPTPLEFVASSIEGSVLGNCEQAAPAAPEAPPAVPPGGAPAGTAISAPNTGDGGSHAPSAWLALPLGGVALLLMGSGFALRRRLR